LSNSNSFRTLHIVHYKKFKDAELVKLTSTTSLVVICRGQEKDSLALL